MDDLTYTLQQLSEISGIEARTIRSYIERDLLPGPYGMGPKASYGTEHRDRLSVIRRLRDAQREITLDQIRSFLSQLGPEKIAAIAAEEMKLGGVESGMPPVSSALAYLMSIVGGSASSGTGSGSGGRRTTGGRRDSSTSPMARRVPLSSAPIPASFPDLFEPSELRSPERFAAGPEEEDFLLELAEDFGSGGRTPFAELLGALGVALNHENVARKVRSETWHRVPITPDVELAARGELDLDQLALLQRIGDHLRHLLMKGTRK